MKYAPVIFLACCICLPAVGAEQEKPLPDAIPPNISTNGLPTIAGSTNAVPPIILPAAEGGTNRVLTAEEKDAIKFEEARQKAEDEYNRKVAEAKKKWDDATNGLKSYHVIPGKNPFRLTKPEIRKPDVKIVRTTTPMTVGVPQLQGISLLRHNKRAVLRFNAPRGGTAEYKFLEVGEMVDGVEVLKILPPQLDGTGGTVEVKVKDKTHTLELEKNTTASFKSDVRPSGTSYRPGSSSRTTSGRSPSGSSSTSRRPSGSSSKNTSGKGTSDRASKIAEWRKKQEEARKASGSGTSPSRPSGSSGGLKGVPQRRRSP